MKILLCNEAFIGDLILSTSVLPVLKKAMPDCEIGFLAGPWAKEVVEDHALIDRVHVYHQLCFNRKKISKNNKRRLQKKSRRAALQEVIDVQYDIAIDLHSYYRENSSYFLFETGIPKRIAYWACGTPYHYNELLFWECRFFHVLENHKIMLETLGYEKNLDDSFGPYLHYKSPISPPHLNELPQKYMVIHIGTGEFAREWDIQSWRTLALKLDKLGLPLVFIGKGESEKRVIDYVIQGLENSYNFCNKFSWKELIPVIKKASFLLGLESMAGHMAALYGIPALLIYAGESHMNWRPYHPYCHVIKPLPIYWKEIKKILPKQPIQMITPEEVFEKAKKLLLCFKCI